MEHSLTEKQQRWLEHVKASIASSLTVSAYAKANNLDVKALYNWRSDFIRKGLVEGKPKKPFAKVKTKPSAPKAKSTPPAKQVITALLPNGVELRFDTLSPEALTLLKAL